MAAGIIGYGVYLPKYRIKREDIAKAWEGRARGENSVCGMDEDIITMGMEASENALTVAGIDPSTKLGAIYLGSGSLPYLEHSSLGVITQTLEAKPEIDLVDFAASPRSSIAALKALKDAIKAERVNCGLVIGSEARQVSAGSTMEIASGDGAASFVLGKEGVIAEIEDIYTYSTYFIDRWRQAGSPYVKEYEPRFTREYGYQDHVIKAGKLALSSTGIGIGEFRYVILQPTADPRVVRQVSRSLGVKPEQTEASDIFPLVGELGAASVPLQIARVLDRAEPSDRILAISYGSGISDAIMLKVKEGIKEKGEKVKSFDYYLNSKDYIDYLKFTKLKGTLKKEEDVYAMGVPPTSPMLWRDGPDIRALRGAKCKRCGYVNFPPSIRKICIRCGNTEFERVKMSKKGKVHAFVVNVYLPPPLEGPLPMIIGDMEDGNWFRALGTEMKLKEVKIDLPVELVLRKIVHERGIGVYTPSFRPLR